MLDPGNHVHDSQPDAADRLALAPLPKRKAFLAPHKVPLSGPVQDPCPPGTYVGSVDSKTEDGMRVWIITLADGTGVVMIPNSDPTLNTDERDDLTIAANQGDNNNKVTVGAAGAVIGTSTR